MSEQDKATTKASVSRALVDYGAIPGRINSLGRTERKTLRALAEGNTAAGTSILGRIGKEHEDITRRIPDVLAGRGMLFSGETGYQLGEEANRFKNVQYDASKGVLDFLAGATAALASREQERALELVGAQQESAFRQQDIQFRKEEMAQQMALAQQQMAFERQMQAQANAANAAAMSGGGGGFDTGAFMDSLFGPEGGGAPMGPTQQEFAIMAAAVPKPVRKRNEQELALFGQYQAWRTAPENANWWK